MGAYRGHRARDRVPERPRVRWIVVLGLRDHPWVLPSALLWWTAAVGWWLHRRAGAARDGEGRDGEGPSAWALVFWCALGGFLAVTVTPSRIGLGLDPDTLPARGCLMQWPLTGFGLTSGQPERRWNVLIGVPMGLAAVVWPLQALLGRRWRRVWAYLAPLVALGAPEAVEAVQALAPGLGRVCAVVDVVDNLSGVLAGFALGAAGVLVHASARSSPRRA